MKQWVKQTKHSTDIVALYTNILTNDKVIETKQGQCFVANKNKLCDKPLDVFVPQEFENWEFYAGGNIVNDDDEEEIILSYGTYCCDGDGFVSVLLVADGTIQLLDQGNYMLDLSSNLDEAIQQASDYLKEQYPEIYVMWLEV